MRNTKMIHCQKHELIVVEYASVIVAVRGRNASKTMAAASITLCKIVKFGVVFLFETPQTLHIFVSKGLRGPQFSQLGHNYAEKRDYLKRL